MKGKDIASADLRYARLERKLRKAEKEHDDVAVNLIAQEMATLEAETKAALFDEDVED